MFANFGLLDWLLAAVLYFAVFLLPLFIAGQARMGRAPYVLRSLVAVLVIVAAVGLAYAASMDALLVGLAVGGVVGFFWLFWSIYRLQDVGWPRRLMVLLLIPVASEILWFLLLIKKGRQAEAALPLATGAGS